MTESGAKIVIRGDAQQFLDVARKVKKELDEAGQKASFGEKMAMGLAKATAKALLLKAALTGAFAEANKIAQLSADSHAAGADVSVSAQLAGAKLGLTGHESLDFISQKSPKRKDEFAGLLSSIGRQRGGASREDIMRGGKLFASGMFEAEEVAEAVGTGGLDALEAEGRRRAQLIQHTTAFENLGIKAFENEQADAAARARWVGGREARLKMAKAGRWEAESPFLAGALNVIGENTGMLGGGAVTDFMKREGQVDGVHAELRKQTELIRQSARAPRVVPSAE